MSRQRSRSMGSIPPYLEDRGEWKQRRCLACDRKFRSTWAGHRICPRCSSDEHSASSASYNLNREEAG